MQELENLRQRTFYAMRKGGGQQAWTSMRSTSTSES